jgi:hypothetical protein
MSYGGFSDTPRDDEHKIKQFKSDSSYHNIQPPKLIHCSLDDRLDLILLAHITPHSDRLDLPVEFVADELRSAFGGFDVDVSEDEGGAFRREEERGFESDSAAGLGVGK